jgi:hypothetical protein
MAAHKLRQQPTRNLSAENRASTEPLSKSIVYPQMLSMFDPIISKDTTEQSVSKAELYTLAREGLEMQIERQKKEYRDRKRLNATAVSTVPIALNVVHQTFSSSHPSIKMQEDTFYNISKRIKKIEDRQRQNQGASKSRSDTVSQDKFTATSKSFNFSQLKNETGPELR